MTKQWRDAWVSRRLATCDYKAPGEYFVTICTHQRACLFGEIANGAMQLSPEGRIAENAWRNLPAHFPNIALDAFVIMPNHIHGVLVFCTEGPALGIVVGGFKAEVSRRLGRRMWQRYYYDHVIRSKRELDQIRSYIAKNPACWATDEENSQVRGEAGKPASYAFRCDNESMALQFTTSYLEDTVSLFHYYKKLAERAMAQVTGEQLFAVLDPEMNSIAVIVKHLTGNLRSRWSDFPNSDGEKPDRDRDGEFTNPPATREEIMKGWEQAWELAFGALASLSDADLTRETTIRGERHSVMQAITRQLAHYAYHCGQIVLLAKHFQSDQWKSLTIPRGQSAKFNQRVKAGETSQR